MRVRHPPTTIQSALALVAAGATHAEAAATTGVSVHTLRTWLYKHLPARATLDYTDSCTECRGPRHAFESLSPEPYAYLLAVYLGDGWLGAHAKSVYSLRIALDLAYPQIIDEIASTVAAIRGRPALVAPDPNGKNYAVVVSYWKQWPCYFPQHGPGRKHTRPIVLEPWQQAHVDAAPGMFLRGLIHTDGWRGLNRVTVKGRDYAYPRYQFSNRSDDIRRLFTATCDQLGIEWRRWGTWHISVARREAVARLDEFVGPKA